MADDGTGVEDHAQVTRTAPQPAPSTPADHRRGLLLIGVAIVLTGLNLRTAVTSVGPVLQEIQDGLGISSGLAGLVTTMPVLCFAAIGFAGPGLSARYRDSQETPTLLNPGEAYKFNIDLWSTSNVFRKGHMLRLEVSSSNFPRFDRNMNTGEDQATAQKSLPAANTIYHDAAHPSALVLPLVAP